MNKQRVRFMLIQWITIGLLLSLCPTTVSAELTIASFSFNSFSTSYTSSQSLTEGSSGSLLLLSARMMHPLNVVLTQSAVLSLGEPEEEALNIEPAVIGKALVYPNPFRLSTGATLGYFLSKNLDITLYIFDMRGHLIYQKLLPSGSPGGLGTNFGYNKISFNQQTFNNSPLSSGVYFYLLVHNNKVLAKSKMAIIP